MKQCAILSLAAFLMVLPSALYCLNSGTEGGARGMHEGAQQETQLPPRDKINTDNLRGILTYKNELSLSDEQIESIRKIREQSIKDAQSNHEAIYNKQLKISDMLSTPKPDFDGARGLMQDLAKDLANMQSITIDAYEKAYNLLTENQKLKFTIIREKLKKESDSQNQLSR